ncbi:hypothetical protein QOT17_007067 [Balamuthia mandrillaris]
MRSLEISVDDFTNKLLCKNQQAPSSSAPSSVTSASSSQQHTCLLSPLCPSTPTSHSLNLISSIQQQSSPTVPAIKQQDPISKEEEYNEFYKSQRSLNSIAITNKMPGLNDPICTPMTINSCRVTIIIDSGASHSFMDPSIIDLVRAKTKQANYTIKLGHHETTTTCAAKTEPLIIGFDKHHFHHMFSVLPQPDGQQIILGHDFMHKSSMGITDNSLSNKRKPRTTLILSLLGEHCKRERDWHDPRPGCDTYNTLNKLVNNDWTHWHTFLPAAQYAINQCITRCHKSSPFQLFFGCPATIP